MIAARPAPLLLLVGAVALWVVLRSLFLLMSGPAVPPPPPLILGDTGPAEPLWPFIMPGSTVAQPPARPIPARRTALAALPPPPGHGRPRLLIAPAPVVEGPVAPRDTRIHAAQSLLLARMLGHRPYAPRPLGFAAAPAGTGNGLPPMLPARRPPVDRWTLAAGLYWRQGSGAPALGNSPTLAGSQAWARLAWQPQANAPQLFVRANSAGRLGRGAEGAVGVALSPDAAVPVHIVAERRQRLAGEGRSAFALYAVGGTALEVDGWRLDSYGAAGIVGAARRDGFAEGSATLARPVARLGPVELTAGSGAWGAVQPGASRLDIGPTLSARTDRLRGARVALDWRQRVAGDAVPPSGPAVTLSVDF